MDLPRERDVVVVGAGPTGLLIAGDLAAAGVRVTVLEQRPEEESNLTRAFAVHARTLEALDARGLADTLITRGARVAGLRFLDRLRIDLSRLPSRFPYVLITPQYTVEHLLEQRAVEHGAEILRGRPVGDIQQDGDGAEVASERDRTRARYLVGADGVGSNIRTALGLPFPGRTVARSVMLADVRLVRAPAETIVANADGDTFAFIAPFGDGWYRVIGWRRDRQLPDDAPVEFEEIRATAAEALGTDYGMHDPRWLSRFHSDERQVPRYRVGRVFLAGDAAHVHSPAGGQGMNTGLQDAANLGWKLAADLQGWAPAGLLDTYQTERHPVGRQALRVSGDILRVALSRRPTLEVISRLARAALTLRPLADRVAGTISGIGIRYPSPPGSHPMVGERAPDVDLAGGGRLYEALRAGQFVLLTADEPAPDVLGDVRHLQVRRLAKAGPAVVVRPDGFVGWAGDRPTAEQLRAAVGRWGLSEITTGSSAAR
jgi:2-polyprenyl-6-methoxyphenol hydroxylase-like FAD-dependent oxidoreductase